MVKKNDISAQIIYKDVKHLRIHITRDGQVRAIAPKNMPTQRIQEFIQQKSSRITKKLDELKQKNKSPIELKPDEIMLLGKAYQVMYAGDMQDRMHLDHTSQILRRGHDMRHQTAYMNRYKHYARKVLGHRLDVLSKQFELPYEKLYIRSQTSKRGTCSSKKNIGLNRRLIKAPARVSDYIIIHELCHLIHMDHSEAFWAELRSRCPKTDKAIKRLKNYGNSLFRDTYISKFDVE